MRKLGSILVLFLTITLTTKAQTYKISAKKTDVWHIASGKMEYINNNGILFIVDGVDFKVFLLEHPKLLKSKAGDTTELVASSVIITRCRLVLDTEEYLSDMVITKKENTEGFYLTFYIEEEEFITYKVD